VDFGLSRDGWKRGSNQIGGCSLNLKDARKNENREGKTLTILDLTSQARGEVQSSYEGILREDKFIFRLERNKG